jgi:hypothetical protein
MRYTMNNQMNQKLNQTNRPNQRSHANFIEALKSIGGQTASSVSKDVVGKISQDFITSVTGGVSPQDKQPSSEHQNTPEVDIHHEIAKIQRHREVVETKVFDQKEEEVKAKIKIIKEELKLLAKELAGMDIQLEKAIEEAIVSPGTYHVSFFEKLRRLIIDLKKRVVDSANWLEISNQRKASQQGYWANVGKSGTKYMLSQERTLATQAG